MTETLATFDTVETLGARIEALSATIEIRFQELGQRLDELLAQLAATSSGDSLAALTRMNAANEAAHARFGSTLADHQRRLLTIERRDPRRA